MEPVKYLGGRYRLIEQLGTGGMSVVWRAYDEVLGRSVAVKVLAAELLADPRSRERIRAEARTAARLSHRHITAVHDYGESGNGSPYVVMELVEGRSLEERLNAGPLPADEALLIGAQLATALAAVHARGLVHRDVKPANVMLTPDGAKLVDFGISAIAGDTADLDGELLGTPAYLAPERLDGAPTAPATDVYALGLLVFKMLTGRLPWDRVDTPATLLTAHRHRRPKPLPAIDGLPGESADACLRCLAKAPQDRPTAGEMALLFLVRPAPVRSAPVRSAPIRLSRERIVGKRPLVRAGAAAGLLATALVLLGTCAAGGRTAGSVQRPAPAAATAAAPSGLAPSAATPSAWAPGDGAAKGLADPGLADPTGVVPVGAAPVGAAPAGAAAGPGGQTATDKPGKSGKKPPKGGKKPKD